jgi:isocitrate lyase
VLSTFELMSAFIEAGAAGVHFEDQHSSAKKCGHLGGKVLVPIQEVIDKLVAARLAADVAGVPTVIIARTDAMGAYLITSDIDPQDAPFIDKMKPRTAEGHYAYCGGMEAAITRSLAVAPYADLIWCETATPNLEEARRFAEAIHQQFPGKPLAYNCSPSFNWKKHLSDEQIATFQQQLGEMGYRFQFITLAGFHSINFGMFSLAKDYSKRGMSAFVDLQEREFQAAEQGFTAVKHQREVGTNYFDGILELVSNGRSATTALNGSTETQQFFEPAPAEQERASPLSIALGLVIKK